MAEDVSGETLADALTLLVNLGKVLLQEAKRDTAASSETFIPRKINTLFGLVTAGANFYRSIGVKTKSEAEAAWQESYQLAAVREQVEELQQLEAEWDSFLESVDKRTTGRRLSGTKMADSLSSDLLLTDVRSGKRVAPARLLGRGQKLLLVFISHFGCLSSRDHVAELEAAQARLEARSVRLLVVSFGSLEGARLWLEQTGCASDVLLDPQRTAYSSFGLGSSYASVLKFCCLMRYAEYEVASRGLPDFPPHLLEDIYQLGGDFLLDDTGTVLFSHPFENPLDTPSVTDILLAAEATRLKL